MTWFQRICIQPEENSPRNLADKEKIKRKEAFGSASLDFWNMHQLVRRISWTISSIMNQWNLKHVGKRIRSKQGIFPKRHFHFFLVFSVHIFGCLFKQAWWCLDTHLFGEPEETWFLSDPTSQMIFLLMSGFHLKRIFQRGFSFKVISRKIPWRSFATAMVGYEKKSTKI